MHELLRRVLVHRDLLEHDLALLVELGERRREHHVGHHLERVLDVPVGHARVDDGVLARRGGVQLRPHRVEGLRDLLRVVRARALEEQVLDEVRDAGAVVPLVARAGADPEAERHRADARHALRDHPLARVQLGQDVLLHVRTLVLFGCPLDELDAGAVALRLVERLVGEAEQRLRVGGVRGARRRRRSSRACRRAVAVRRARLAPIDLARVVLATPRRAATANSSPPMRNARRPCAAPRCSDLRERLERLVAGRMAEAVVQLLEAVEVAEHEAERAAVAVRARDLRRRAASTNARRFSSRVSGS